LPGWLHFDANSSNPGFSGTPGYFDTNFYALREIPIILEASDGILNASTIFIINVGGTSWGELLLKIVAPVLSAITAIFTLYELRGYLLNRCCKGRYEKQPRNCSVGNAFTLRVIAPAEQIHGVALRLPARRSCCYCCHFVRLPPPLPGHVALPTWMEYDSDINELRSKGPIPAHVAGKNFVVQVWGAAGVILEQYQLTILPPESNSPAGLREANEASALIGLGSMSRDKDLSDMSDSVLLPQGVPIEGTPTPARRFPPSSSGSGGEIEFSLCST